MKKIMFMLLIAISCGMMTACGGAAATNLDESKAEAEIKLSEINLDNTIWSGVDISSGDEYVMEFASDSYNLCLIRSEKCEEYSGTYAITDEGITLNGIDVLKKTDNISLVVDANNSYIDLDGIKMVPDDSKNIEEAVEKLGMAQELNSILNSGYCWIACSNGQALILYVNGEESSIKTVASLGDGKVAVQDLKGSWSLNGNSFTIYSQNNQIPSDFKWELEKEEDVIGIKLTSDEKESHFYQTTVANIEEAIELANQYITKQTSIDEVEDFTHLLDGYEGVSIVDGMVYAGVDPSYSNRSVIAEKIGIENYRGTAKQNLYMIEYMGGIVK